ncbi:recombination mediator RecR [Flexilinea flocculi]|jgi:recombination protein RecR|uniref:Recombination protein RecR n=1 Tax=Flexilinea flocculi TaxID=1678840 RepID=A0A0S7BXG0_9CHLR|nr:recombination mediator RecR [Flexilinea flocculi]NMB94748.1 recombination protein RecR [Flexilinea flocculi]GAP41440.1 DNA replication and repair protein RecR [Flexilinea flocculi]
MSNVPAPVQNLIDAFSRLPGIGPRTASRLTFFLLRNQDDIGLKLAEALVNLKSATGLCKECFNITLSGQDRCEICSNDQRDQDVICVVEAPMDVIVLEQSGGFKGKYHVLHGVLSPIEGINPEDIRLEPLFKRIAEGKIREVIIATNPSMEGDATALYIRQKLEPYHIRITRLARGLPAGGELEYADQNTLLRALSGRQEI